MNFKSLNHLLLATIIKIIVFIGSEAMNAQTTTDENFRLMELKGSYKVGHQMLDWTDKSRKEPATKDSSDFRIIPVQIWYPANLTAKGKTTAYRPRIEAFRSKWGDESVNFMNAVKTFSIEEADLNDNGPFDVFIFSHGWGSRSSSHSTMLSNLASYGYIVVGINHPYMGNVALPNGEITEPNDFQFLNQEAANLFYADDVVFVLDQLAVLNEKETDRFFRGINMEGIIAGGHSSGSPAASGGAISDNRIKGVISFDAGVPKIVRRRGLDVPIFLFRADTLSYTDLFFKSKNMNSYGTFYPVDFFRKHRADFYDFVISGTTHNLVYDEYLFTDNKEEKELSMRNHQIIVKQIDAFFAKILHGKYSSLLESSETDNYKLRIIKAPPK